MGRSSEKREGTETEEMSLFDLEDLLRSRRVPDKNYESCSECIHADDSLEMCVLRRCIHAKGELQECYVPKQPERQKGEWIDYTEDGYVECPFCHNATNCDGNKDELHFCFSCGADLREDEQE